MTTEQPSQIAALESQMKEQQEMQLMKEQMELRNQLQVQQAQIQMQGQMMAVQSNNTAGPTVINNNMNNNIAPVNIIPAAVPIAPVSIAPAAKYYVASAVPIVGHRPPPGCLPNGFYQKVRYVGPVAWALCFGLCWVWGVGVLAFLCPCDDKQVYTDDNGHHDPVYGSLDTKVGPCQC